MKNLLLTIKQGHKDAIAIIKKYCEKKSFNFLTESKLRYIVYTDKFTEDMKYIELYSMCMKDGKIEITDCCGHTCDINDVDVISTITIASIIQEK